MSMLTMSKHYTHHPNTPAFKDTGILALENTLPPVKPVGEHNRCRRTLRKFRNSFFKSIDEQSSITFFGEFVGLDFFIIGQL